MAQRGEVVAGNATRHHFGLPELEARRWPARSGAPASLGLLCHGFTEGPGRWDEFVRHVAPRLPGMAFSAPAAPHRSPASSHGRQWWDYNDARAGVAEAGVRAGAHALTMFLVQELSRTSLPLTACVLVGFSQGAMVALHAALRLPTAPAGVLCIAGRLLVHAPQEVTARPPVMLVHGTDDVPVPAAESVAAGRMLAAWDIAAEVRLIAGLGHELDARAMEEAATFLRARAGGG